MTGLMESWVDSANDPACRFPLNNLPCGVFSTADSGPRCGMAIGDFVLDLGGLEAAGTVRLPYGLLLGMPFWNGVMAAGPEVWRDLRTQVTALLVQGADPQPTRPYLVPLADVTLHLPFTLSEYTDFYASRDHATNVGTMFRGAENALPPNWLHIPIGYNGRVKGPNDAAPRFAPSARFDIELELGAVVGLPSEQGYPVTVAQADAMIFGYVLLNDWSARDIQAWEYQPLGPFQSKATATSISPWIVMKAALEPFRTPAPPREVPLLPHLAEPGPMLYDIALQVGLTPEGGTETIISRTNYAGMYYSAPQQLAHHTTSGCPMNVGDLLGSGTISGPTKDSRGSLLELSWGGKEPFPIAGGSRSFIEDNDTLTLRGHAQGNGYRIGFGECLGKVLPALADPYAE
jgi:fumarylacetoacetase